MNAHQRRHARRHPPRTARTGTVAEWADIAERFANRHRDVTAFTLDPTRPTRALFEEGVHSAVTRSGFE